MLAFSQLATRLRNKSCWKEVDIAQVYVRLQSRKALDRSPHDKDTSVYRRKLFSFEIRVVQLCETFINAQIGAFELTTVVNSKAPFAYCLGMIYWPSFIFHPLRFAPTRLLNDMRQLVSQQFLAALTAGVILPVCKKYVFALCKCLSSNRFANIT
ncbi:hypothetical protein SAMN03159341_11463 [Paenibacillus sp. 1_12]|nr:hypothetical protein SAMN03159341_11463 [Paenibacillus sp. 1_12]